MGDSTEANSPVGHTISPYGALRRTVGGIAVPHPPRIMGYPEVFELLSVLRPRGQVTSTVRAALARVGEGLNVV